MSLPGFEPGLSRPQRDVLTARRKRLSVMARVEHWPIYITCLAQTFGAAREEFMWLSVRDSIVVSISACHADDPGSIPGRGVSCLSVAHLSPATIHAESATRCRQALSLSSSG